MYFKCIIALLESLGKIKRILVIELLHEVHIISERPELAMLCSATIMFAVPSGRCGIDFSVEITMSTIFSTCDANKISRGHDHNKLSFGVFGSVNL